MQLAAPAPSDGAKAAGSRSLPPPRFPGWGTDPHAREVVRLEVTYGYRGRSGGARCMCSLLHMLQATACKGPRLQEPWTAPRDGGSRSDPHAREVVRF